MRVSLDSNVCQGHARCNLICPEVFDLDEAGYAVLMTSEVPAEHEAAVADAAMNCPEQAISTS